MIVFAVLDAPTTVLRMRKASGLMGPSKPIARERLLAAVQLALAVQTP